MKRSKFIVCTGVALLLTGITLNVKNALEDYGLLTISLHPCVAAQVSISGATTGMGKQAKAIVDCERTDIVSSTSSGSSSTTSGKGWDVSASVSAGAGNVSGSAGGKYGKTSGKSSSTSTSTTTSSSVKSTWKAEKFWCTIPDEGEDEKKCYNLNPCIL